MAGNYIVIDSKFKPFSYDDMLKPLLQSTQAHQAVEENFSNLSTEAAKMEALMNSQSDSKSYGMYSKYTEDLKTQADKLAKEGLTPGSKQDLFSLRSRYSSEIEPIKAASTEYSNMIDYRQQVASKDNSALFKKDYTSIDDFLGGKRADNSYISTKDIISRVAAKAEAIGKSLYTDPQFTAVLGKQKYQVMQRNGVPLEQITAVLMQDPDAQPALKALFDEEWKALGADEYNEAAQLQIKNAIVTGLYAALQKPTYSYMNNENQINAYQSKVLNLQTEEFNDSKTRYTDQQKQLKIQSGQEPYREGTDGTKYYSNGVAMWEVKPDGTETKPIYMRKTYDPDAPDALEATTKTKAIPYISIDFQGPNAKKIGTGTSEFNVKNSEEISPDQLSAKQRTKIMSVISEKGLTLDDVSIYRDIDKCSRNEYRVVTKGYNADGATRKPTGEATPPAGTTDTGAAGGSADDPAGL